MSATPAEQAPATTAGALPPALSELHRQCRADYAKGTAQRERAACTPAPALGLPDPGELATAIRVGQRMLARYGTVDGADLFAYAQAHGGLTEALRILLRALDTEVGEGQ